MAGRSSRNKGGVYERELVTLLQELGFHAERVYGSGAIGTRLNQETAQQLTGDVYIEIPLDALLEYGFSGSDKRVELNDEGIFTHEVEVKYRSGSAGFPKWLRNLEHPIRIEDDNAVLGAMPGYNVVQTILHDFSKDEVCKHKTRRYTDMMQTLTTLSVRFPKPGTKSKTGWVTLVRLS